MTRKRITVIALMLLSTPALRPGAEAEASEFSLYRGQPWTEDDGDKQTDCVVETTPSTPEELVANQAAIDCLIAAVEDNAQKNLELLRRQAESDHEQYGTDDDGARLFSQIEHGIARARSFAYGASKAPEPGQASLASLPPEQWWRMFVDVAAWDDGALAFDRQRSPGYYAAMMKAFATYVMNADAQPMTSKLYDEMHRAVTTGVWDGRRPVEHKLTGSGDKGTTFALATVPDDIVDRAAIAEVGADKLATFNANAKLGALTARLATVLGLTELKGAAPVTLSLSGSGSPGTMYLMATVSHGDAARFVQDAFDLYYRSAQGEPVKAIASLIRRLHLGHAYSDGNGRLNTMLVLNRLLREQKLPPSIVTDTSIFGGRATVAELAHEIRTGQERFQNLVQTVYVSYQK